MKLTGFAIGLGFGVVSFEAALVDGEDLICEVNGLVKIAAFPATPTQVQEQVHL